MLTSRFPVPLQVFVCVVPSASSLVTPGSSLRLEPIWGSPSHYGTKSNLCTPPTSARGRRGQHNGREHIVRCTIPPFSPSPSPSSPSPTTAVPNAVVVSSPGGELALRLHFEAEHSNVLVVTAELLNGCLSTCEVLAMKMELLQDMYPQFPVSHVHSSYFKRRGV